MEAGGKKNSFYLYNRNESERIDPTRNRKNGIQEKENETVTNVQFYGRQLQQITCLLMHLFSQGAILDNRQAGVY